MRMLRVPVHRRAVALAALALMLAPAPAFAHHPMGGTLPASFQHGLLSGLGHPIIGLDHLAAVIAVGCLAAWHPAGWRLVTGYVLAMMAGAAVHVQGVGVPAAEILVGLSVIALGLALFLRRPLPAAVALGLFAVVGLLHGYALGESIIGAEPTPLIAYFAGLAVVQTAIGLGVMAAARRLGDRRVGPLSPAHTAGVVVALVGVVSLLAA